MGRGSLVRELEAKVSRLKACRTSLQDGNPRHTLTLKLKWTDWNSC